MKIVSFCNAVLWAFVLASGLGLRAGADEDKINMQDNTFTGAELEGILEDFDFEETAPAGTMTIETEQPKGATDTGDTPGNDEFVLDFQEAAPPGGAPAETGAAVKNENELNFEEIPAKGNDFLDNLQFTDNAFDETFRNETATYGFLVSFANEKMGLVTGGTASYDTLVEAFAGQGYYDFTVYLPDDLVTREVFADFLFQIVKQRGGDADESVYTDKVQWAVDKGYLKPVDGEVPVEASFSAAPFDAGADTAVLEPYVDPDRIAGTVDGDSVVTLRFVTADDGGRSFQVMRKEDYSGTYAVVGTVTATDKSFVDRDGLAAFKTGRNIDQYQIARSAGDFIVTVSYLEPSGAPVEKKVFYQIVPVGTGRPAGTSGAGEPVLPEFLSARVDFTGNIFLRWSVETAGRSFTVLRKDPLSGEFTAVGRDVTGAEFADKLSGIAPDAVAVKEFEIARTVDEFTLTVSYTDIGDVRREVRCAYKVIAGSGSPGGMDARDGGEFRFDGGGLGLDTPSLKAGQLTRGDIIDGFNMLADQYPALRGKAAGLPLFSDAFIIPVSPI